MLNTSRCFAAGPSTQKALTDARDVQKGPSFSSGSLYPSRHTHTAIRQFSQTAQMQLVSAPPPPLPPPGATLHPEG